MKLRKLIWFGFLAVGIYYFFLLYRYFRYWGLGLGVLLLFSLTIIIATVALIVSVINNRRFLYQVLRTGIVRLTKTKWWQWIDRGFRHQSPRLYSTIRSTINITTPTGVGLVAGILVSFFFVFLFIGTTFSVLFSVGIARADLRMIYFLRTVTSDQMNYFFIFFTHLADTLSVMIIFALTVLYLLAIQRYRTIAYITLAVASSLTLTNFLKWIIYRSRPAGINVIPLPFDPSFPSGHALVSVCVYGFIAYLLFKATKNYFLKIVSIVFFTIVIVLIGLSRVYLGVHFPSDIIGGWYTGLALLALLITFFEVDHWLRVPGLTGIRDVSAPRKFQVYYFGIFILTLASFSLWQYMRTDVVFSPDAVYTVPSLGAFLEHANHYSEDLVGKRTQPISFIVIGSGEQLETLFSRAGWHKARNPQLLNILKLLSTLAKNDPYQDAPMTPAFYNSRTNDYGFEKPTEENTSRQRHHTRYWKSGYRLGDRDIWVATASLDEGIGIGSKIKFLTHLISPYIDTERELIFSDLQNAGTLESYQMIDLVGPTYGTNASGDRFVTDGKAYILYLGPYLAAGL